MVVTDGQHATHRRFEGTHKTRFVEIFPACRDERSGDRLAACYNTIFTSEGIPPTKDTAPQSLVEGLDFEEIKKEYGVAGALLNGPKLWLLDWVEVDVGFERHFDSLRAVRCATLSMNNTAGGVAETTPYRPMAIARKSGLGWNKGTTVLLLDDSDGNTWVMKGFQLGLNPQHDYQDFMATAASRFKKLPPGWKVRLKTLESDLIERPEGGIATIMANEFFNVYDKTGPGMTNFTP